MAIKKGGDDDILGKAINQKEPRVGGFNYFHCRKFGGRWEHVIISVSGGGG